MTSIAEEYLITEEFTVSSAYPRTRAESIETSRSWQTLPMSATSTPLLVVGTSMKPSTGSIVPTSQSW